MIPLDPLRSPAARLRLYPIAEVPPPETQAAAIP
jgi:hypothetical protein